MLVCRVQIPQQSQTFKSYVKDKKYIGRKNFVGKNRIKKYVKLNFKPLIIYTLRDKIVQQAAYLTLNAIYEPVFLNSSYGLRFNRGNHSALYSIKYHTSKVKWCIKVNIAGNFSSNFYHILFNILNRRIKCFKFFALVKKYTKSGHKENTKFYESGYSFFQGNVIHSILISIYLHEFDVFMQFLTNSLSKSYKR